MYYDVAIVGASSAGLYAAERIARTGTRVAVFERQQTIAPKRRTLIVTPRWLDVLGYTPDESILHEIEVMSVATPNAQVDITFRDPDIIMERSRFTRHLVQRATAAGADLYRGYRFTGVAPHPDGAVLTFQTDDGTAGVTAQAVVGADGLFSDVGAAAGIERPPAVPILQAEVELPSGWDSTVTQCWFDVDETRFFYWLIPESDRRGVLGLVGDDRAQTRELLHRFLARQGLAPLAFQGAQVAMHRRGLRPWGRVGEAPVYLVGDAAGQVKVTTVGGTVTGLLGAEAAARALSRGTSYRRELRPLNRELDVHWFLRLLLDRMTNADYDRLVRNITPPVQRFLSRYNRDEMAGTAWKLPVLQPQFLLTGLRILLRQLTTDGRRPATGSECERTPMPEAE